jgi:hypothetical protein
MKNLHIISTEKPSRLHEFGNIWFNHKEPKECFRNYNIYITSDEEIKDVIPHKGKWQLEKEQILNKFPNYLTDLSECKLVIMTTDPDLIADGVQSISDEFLEWFVKNPSCEEVEVKKRYSDFTVDPFVGYKIIIPQEEPKQETLEEIEKNIDREEWINFFKNNSKEEILEYLINYKFPL